jgi:hypothetical protein
MLFLWLCIGVGSAFERAAGDPVTLGRSPLCEPSAAMLIPCPADTASSCLLVGDNEVRDRLFFFPYGDGEVKTTDQKELFWENSTTNKKRKMDDIEAFIDSGDGQVLAIGSHSRNKRCEFKKRRNRVLRGSVASNHLNNLDIFRAKTEKSCDFLFAGAVPSDRLTGAICEAIASAEHAAANIEAQLEDGAISKDEAETQCKSVTAFNIEGAVNISSTAEPDIWLGLRAPLLPADPRDSTRKDLAILLRWTGLPASPNQFKGLRIDQIAVLDLGGFGVREMVRVNGTIWGISGPPQDSSVPFRLWRFNVTELKPGAFIKPHIVRDLATSAEGLAIIDNRAYVVIDGDNGDGSVCAVDAHLESFGI